MCTSTLKDMPRGQHFVFKSQDENIWGIGWSDVHSKLYLSTCGESIYYTGSTSLKFQAKIWRRNFAIAIDRPKVIAEYAKNMRNVDLHNDRYRQGMLKLRDVWPTKTRQTRLQNEQFAPCAVDVDAFLLAKTNLLKYKPTCEEPGWPIIQRSVLFKWSSALIIWAVDSSPKR